eukprot:UN25214
MEEKHKIDLQSLTDEWSLSLEEGKKTVENQLNQEWETKFAATEQNWKKQFNDQLSTINLLRTKIDEQSEEYDEKCTLLEKYKLASQRVDLKRKKNADLIEKMEGLKVKNNILEENVEDLRCQYENDHKKIILNYEKRLNDQTIRYENIIEKYNKKELLRASSCDTSEEKKEDVSSEGEIDDKLIDVRLKLKFMRRALAKTRNDVKELLHDHTCCVQSVVFGVIKSFVQCERNQKDLISENSALSKQINDVLEDSALIME